jgi:hypothetical protein
MTPTLIVDCSMAMAWCFADETTPETSGIQDRLASEAAANRPLTLKLARCFRRLGNDL